MKIPTWIIVTIGLGLINYLAQRLNKKLEKDFDKETYIVTSSGVTKVVIVIELLFFLTVFYLAYNESPDLAWLGALWWMVYIPIAIVVFFIIGYWERVCFRVCVYKDKFVVRNLFLREKEYLFSDLTNYYEMSSTGAFEAYIGSKNVLSIAASDVGYRALRFKVKESVENNRRKAAAKKRKKDEVITVSIRWGEAILGMFLGGNLIAMSISGIHEVLTLRPVDMNEQMRAVLAFGVVGIVAIVWAIILFNIKIICSNGIVTYRIGAVYKRQYRLEDL